MPISDGMTVVGVVWHGRGKECRVNDSPVMDVDAGKGKFIIVVTGKRTV